jgi:6-pyruvoyltetrahydropterin/6-carboxytetrahydropterin synthase
MELNAEIGALKIELGRRYRFAASHRLHSARLSEEENFRVYGKCNNPHGHGHNYVVEISLSGDVDRATGMIANLTDLDGFVEREILEAFDHRSLNEEVAAFRDTVPTTENLCVEIFRRLKTFPRAKLERVRVEETGNNSFEYAGDNLFGDVAGAGVHSEGNPL